MASTKIRGITIELGADTSGLSKALKGVNTEIKSTQKQLKDVERLLKLDPGNTELLEQKQRLLGQTVEQTAKKLDALKEAQKQVADEMEKTGKGQEQYDALTREIEATERELKEAEQAAKSFNVTTEKIAASANKLAGKFDTVAQKTKRLSQVAGGLLAGLGALAIKTAQDADELQTLSKQTGVTTDELQKMKYAADLIDVDVDDMVGAMKKLKKAVGSGKDAFEELGVATKNSQGEYRDITDIFYDTVEALSQIPNETERDIVAMELFGKSADELAGVIDDGGLALKQLGEEAENMGLIIPQEQIDKAVELNDTIDQLKAEATGTFAELGTEIAEMLLPYMPEIKENLEKILEKIRELDPEELELAAKGAAILAIISPIASAMNALANSVSLVISFAGKLSSFFASIGSGTAIVVGAITTFVALIAGNVALFSAYLETMKEGFASAADWIHQKMTDLGVKFSEGLGFMDNTLQAWTEGVGAVLEAFVNLVGGIFQTLGALVTGKWSEMWDGCKLALASFLDAAIAILRTVANTVLGIVNDIISGINKLFDIDIGKIPLIPDASIVDEWRAMKKTPTIVVGGGMATGGTISNGSAIVGEAGAEILTVSGGSATVTPLRSGGGGEGDVVGLLETYLPYLASGNTIVMDSGALVGSIAPDMNAALGTIAIRGGKR